MTELNKNAPRNALTISITQELFNKGARQYSTTKEAKQSLASAIKKLDGVQTVTANTTNPEKFVCDVLIGTNALSLVAEATVFLNALYKICDQWAGITVVQQSPTVTTV